VRRTDDDGSMTVVTVGLVVIAATLAATLAVAGGLDAAKTRAQGAADASALAAAFDARDRRAVGAAYLGASAASCRVAGEVTAQWGASLASCIVDSRGVVSVDVTVPAPIGNVSATSRAGPSSRRGRRADSLPLGRAKRATR
jgi:hypothetical protein